MASIRQIAKVTGFSPATVSRVLNHDPQLAVKNSTRRTITQAAHQLGYQAGHLSQIAAMNLQQSQILVLQVPQDPTLAYFSTINQGIRDEAALHGPDHREVANHPRPGFLIPLRSKVPGRGPDWHL